MVDTTRRLFLRGAAAVPVVAATAGGQIATAAASTLGAAANASSAAGKAGIAEALLRAGGYPAKALFYIGSRNPKSLSSQTAINELAARILGNAPFKTRECFHEKSGDSPISIGEKIDFSFESSLVNYVQNLPSSMPLSQLLDPDLIEMGLEAYANQPHDLGGMQLQITPDHLKKASEILRSLIKHPDETARDIQGHLRQYFLRLANHAINNPSDFETSFGTWREDKTVYANSKIKEIAWNLRELTPFETRSTEVSDMIDRLEKLGRTEEERVREIGNRINEQKIREYLARLKDYLDSNSDKKPFVCKILCIKQKRGILMQETSSNTAHLTRMDWLQWVQSLDPQNTKSSDIIEHESGLGILVQNEKTCAFLHKKLGGEDRKIIELPLPNRRMGVDLNSRKQERPVHPSPAQG
ncbi:MAG TPA: hypothetical protein PLO23_04915 [Alphaproteobacteria bacterium]|nr:hypothetical protein [Alphaproteobacteria bacterium]